MQRGRADAEQRGESRRERLRTRWLERRAAQPPHTRPLSSGPGRPYGVHVRNTTGPGRGTWAALVKTCRGNMETGELARRLGIDRGTVSRWESGRATPRRPEVVQRFAELFALDLDDTLTVAGLRPAGPEVAPTPAMRWDPNLMELQRMLDDPKTPEETKALIRQQGEILRVLFQRRREAG